MARIPFFCKPYPDELFFSVLCRSCCFPDEIQFKKALIQMMRYDGFPPFFPVAYERLVRVLPKGFLSQKDFIERHSVLPYYAQFSPPGRYARMLKVALSGGRGGGALFPKTKLYFCAACIGEDEASPNREPYLRSLHQVKGYSVCHRHQTKLQLLIPDGSDEARLPYSLHSLAHLHSNPSTNSFSEIERILSEDLASVRRAFSGLTYRQIWEGLFMRCHGTDRTCNFSAQLAEKVLATLQSLPDLKLNNPKKDISIREYQRGFRPVVTAFVMILLRCLGESPFSFAELIRQGRTNLSFHPCRNPLCVDFGKKVVPDDRKFLPELAFYLFTCPTCEFAFVKSKRYLRWSIRSFPYSLGPDMPEFRKLWNDPSVSTGTILKKFRIPKYQALYLAYFQGLETDRLPYHAKIFRKIIKNRRSKLIRLRSFILKAFDKDPKLIINARRSSFKIRNACIGLRRLDPEWFQELLSNADPRTNRTSLPALGLLTRETKREFSL